jgi:hypothetical protein
VHALAPEPLNVPNLQILQVEEDICENSPAEQAVHDAYESDRGCYILGTCAAAQNAFEQCTFERDVLTTEVAPTIARNIPAGQLVHEPPFPNLPTGHIRDMVWSCAASAGLTT